MKWTMTSSLFMLAFPGGGGQLCGGRPAALSLFSRVRYAVLAFFISARSTFKSDENIAVMPFAFSASPLETNVPTDISADAGAAMNAAAMTAKQNAFTCLKPLEQMPRPALVCVISEWMIHLWSAAWAAHE